MIPILFFAIVSYLLGHIVDIFSNYFPFQATLSKLFFFSPLAPDPYPDLSDFSEEAQQRFKWASYDLFLEDGTVSDTTGYPAVELAETYLLRKGERELQMYQDLSSVFRQLAKLFIPAALVAGLIIIISHNTSPYQSNGRLLYYLLEINTLPAILGVVSFVSYLIYYISKSLTFLVQVQLFSEVLTAVSAIFAFLSLFGPALFSNVHYTPLLSIYLGGLFAYSPLLFLLTSYIFFHLSLEYKRRKRARVIMKFYAIAVTEGDVEK